MTSSTMGQRRWKESWSDNGTGRRNRRNSLDRNAGGNPGTTTTTAAALTTTSSTSAAKSRCPGSAVSSLTDLSLERCNTRASFLMRDHSSLSSHVDCTSYQEKLQGWQAVFHDQALVAPRPGTSINALRSHHHHPAINTSEINRELSFLSSNRSPAFPDKPREIYDPLDGILPSSSLVAQRKYYVLPSIGMPGGGRDLLLRRQHTSLDTLNQLDYSRERLEDDAEFFTELMELKRESKLAAAASAVAPHPKHGSVNPLPPIHKLKDVVRPRTNIAELDEERAGVSGRQSPAGMSDVSDPEAVRARTPEQDLYAQLSPAKLSSGSVASTSVYVGRSRGSLSLAETDCESVRSVPVIDAVFRSSAKD